MILILGKIPPPIGGVTIHVQRLISKLEEQNELSYMFMELTKVNLIKLIFTLFKYKKIHLHSSSVIVRFLISIIGKLNFCDTLITFHGDIGRYQSSFYNKLDILTIKIANFPILLNDKSLKIAKKHNINSLKISSFIPPNIKNETLENYDYERIKNLNKNITILFCTNAYNLTFDKYGQEIYGIFEILEIFKNKPKFGLIFSDPSGAYSKEIKRKNITLSSNIIIINNPHSFYKILELSDVSIRNTTTDGDSLSVKESLYLNKITLCSNVVSRPDGVISYKKGELKNTISNISSLKNSDKKKYLLDGTINLLRLYKK